MRNSGMAHWGIAEWRSALILFDVHGLTLGLVLWALVACCPIPIFA